MNLSSMYRFCAGLHGVSHIITGVIVTLTLIRGVCPHVGREFVLGFIENRIILDYPVARIFLSTGSTRTIRVHISTPGLSRGARRGGSSQQFQDATYAISALKPAIHELPYQIHMLGNGIEDKGVVISATGDISVHAASINDLTTDAYSALPVSALGTSYYGVSYVYPNTSIFEQGPSEIGLIAIEDDTEIEILIPPETRIEFPGYDVIQDGRRLLLILGQFQTFQLQSEDDLTGIRVTSSKKLAVLGGAMWTAIDKDLVGDHLLIQLTPVNLWGNQFIASATVNDGPGDLVRILGAGEKTDFQLTMLPSKEVSNHSIEPGEYMDVSIAASNFVYIESASNPLLVAQFSKSVPPDGSMNVDPFMFLTPPLSQFMDYYTFTTINTLTEDVDYTHTLNIIVHSSGVGRFVLDGRLLSSGDFVAGPHPNWQRISDTNFRLACLQLSPGSHILQQADGVPFGGVVYGVKKQESYGYSLGLAAPFRRDNVKQVLETVSGVSEYFSTTGKTTSHPETSTMAIELSTNTQTQPSMTSHARVDRSSPITDTAGTITKNTDSDMFLTSTAAPKKQPATTRAREILLSTAVPENANTTEEDEATVEDEVMVNVTSEPRLLSENVTSQIPSQANMSTEETNSTSPPSTTNSSVHQDTLSTASTSSTTPTSTSSASSTSSPPSTSTSSVSSTSSPPSTSSSSASYMSSSSSLSSTSTPATIHNSPNIVTQSSVNYSRTEAEVQTGASFITERAITSSPGNESSTPTVSSVNSTQDSAIELETSNYEGINSSQSGETATTLSLDLSSTSEDATTTDVRSKVPARTATGHSVRDITTPIYSGSPIVTTEQDNMNATQEPEFPDNRTLPVDAKTTTSNFQSHDTTHEVESTTPSSTSSPATRELFPNKRSSTDSIQPNSPITSPTHNTTVEFTTDNVINSASVSSEATNTEHPSSGHTINDDHISTESTTSETSTESRREKYSSVATAETVATESSFITLLVGASSGTTRRFIKSTLGYGSTVTTSPYEITRSSRPSSTADNTTHLQTTNPHSDSSSSSSSSSSLSSSSSPELNKTRTGNVTTTEEMTGAETTLGTTVRIVKPTALDSVAASTDRRLQIAVVIPVLLLLVISFTTLLLCYFLSRSPGTCTCLFAAKRSGLGGELSNRVSPELPGGPDTGEQCGYPHSEISDDYDVTDLFTMIQTPKIVLNAAEDYNRGVASPHLMTGGLTGRDYTDKHGSVSPTFSEIRFQAQKYKFSMTKHHSQTLRPSDPHAKPARRKSSKPRPYSAGCKARPARCNAVVASLERGQATLTNVWRVPPPEVIGRCLSAGTKHNQSDVELEFFSCIQGGIADPGVVSPRTKTHQSTIQYSSKGAQEKGSAEKKSVARKMDFVITRMDDTQS